MLQFFAFQCKT